MAFNPFSLAEISSDTKGTGVGRSRAGTILDSLLLLVRASDAVGAITATHTKYQPKRLCGGRNILPVHPISKDVTKGIGGERKNRRNGRERGE